MICMFLCLNIKDYNNIKTISIELISQKIGTILIVKILVVGLESLKQT